MIAATPEPPYYAVIFTSLQTENIEGYAAMSDRMVELAQQQPGFLGFESAREASADGGLGITVSYWTDLESIRAWHAHTEHRVAQDQGLAQWYARFSTRICRVERAYVFNAESRGSRPSGT